MEEHIIADKTLIRTAKVISAVLTPFSIPFLAFLVLFIFSYLRIMPLQYKLIVLGVVYCFTILMPTLTIFIFRKINGFSPEELVERKRRYMYRSSDHHLCILPAHDAPAQYPVVHDRYHTLRPGSDDNLRHCQLKMETERTHGRRRSRNWWTGSFQRLVQLQSRMVAMPLYTGGWSAGHRPHHPATPHTGRSTCRLCRRARLLTAGAPPAEQCFVLRALLNFYFKHSINP